ncbi:MAG: hypothetical protein M1837_007193 [Sclerophora amabilis]|nr:MAG: hypothetical protein M1837_007193 [Sclerophora amabilis]
MGNRQKEVDASPAPVEKDRKSRKRKHREDETGTPVALPQINGGAPVNGEAIIEGKKKKAKKDKDRGIPVNGEAAVEGKRKKDKKLKSRGVLTNGENAAEEKRDKKQESGAVLVNGEAAEEVKKKKDKKEKSGGMLVDGENAAEEKKDKINKSGGVPVNGEATLEGKKKKKDKKQNRGAVLVNGENAAEEKKDKNNKSGGVPVNRENAIEGKKDKKRTKRRKDAADGAEDEDAGQVNGSQRQEEVDGRPGEAMSVDKVKEDDVKQDGLDIPQSTTAEPEDATTSRDKRRREKRKKKEKGRQEPNGDVGANAHKPSPVNGNDQNSAEAASKAVPNTDEKTQSSTNDSDKKNHRFIPSSIRHITQKPEEGKSKAKRSSGKKSDSAEGKEGQSKGYAFLEFDSYERMETCLRTFHHSMVGGRRINVELTAGGGGSSSARREKIYTKNEKLTEERRKRREKEYEQQYKGDNGKAKVNGEGEGGEDVRGDIHPSRRARVKG